MVQRTRDNWSGPTKYSALCASHFTSDCFEPNSAIAASMGLTMRRRLSQLFSSAEFPEIIQVELFRTQLRHRSVHGIDYATKAIPTIFERRIPRNYPSGACGSGPATSSLRKRDASTPEATNSVIQPKRPRQAYEKRERSRVRRINLRDILSFHF